MPLKLVAPRPGKTPFYAARGTYLGCYIDRSLKTGDRRLAKQLLAGIERDIERGAITGAQPKGFAAAATDYMRAGGERRFLKPLIAHFKHKPLTEIGQTEIDHAAHTIHPDASPATRNRQVYSPVSAILKREGFEKKIHRPKGAEGRKLTYWLNPEQTFALFKAAAKVDREFALFLQFLCYTGARLSDGLKIRCENVDLSANYALFEVTKNGKPRGVYLTNTLVALLRKHPRGLRREEERLFRFTKSGLLYELLDEALQGAKIELPSRVAFHVFCHTWATWMRRYGGLDTFDLTKTERWSDPDSAARYAHVVVSETAKKAELLPVPKKRRAR